MAYCVSQYESSACVPECVARDVNQMYVNATHICVENSITHQDTSVKGSLSIGGSALQTFRANEEWSDPTYVDVRKVSVGAEFPVGTQYDSGYATYRYVSVPASTAIAAGAVVGSLKQSAAAAGATNTGTFQFAVAAQAAAVGATSITVTAVAAAVAANAFSGGLVHVEQSTAAGVGTTYRVLSNTAAAAAGDTFILTLFPDSPVSVAVALNDDVTVTPNDYANVLGALGQDAVPAQYALGVAAAAVDADPDNVQHAWLQTSGVGTLLAGRDLAFRIGVPIFHNNSAGGVAGGALQYAAAPSTVALYNNVIAVGVSLVNGNFAAGEGVAATIGGDIVP